MRHAPPWPYAARPQFEPDEIKEFRGRLWVSAELAESKLQWWQERDWQSGWVISRLEAHLKKAVRPSVVSRLRAAIAKSRAEQAQP